MGGHCIHGELLIFKTQDVCLLMGKTLKEILELKTKEDIQKGQTEVEEVTKWPTNAGKAQ